MRGASPNTRKKGKFLAKRELFYFFREYRTNEVVRGHLHFCQMLFADFEGFLAGNQKIRKKQMAEKALPDAPPNCAVLP